MFLYKLGKLLQKYPFLYLTMMYLCAIIKDVERGDHMIKYIFSGREIKEDIFISNLVYFRETEGVEYGDEVPTLEEISHLLFDDISHLVLFANTRHYLIDDNGATYRIETDLNPLILNLVLTNLVIKRLGENYVISS